MIYFKCPTCKTLLADKQLPLEEGLERICQNQKLSEEQKEREKRKLFDDLEINRICCRMRFLGYIKLIDLIK